MALKPSVRAVLVWANGRFVAHWRGLCAIGLLAALVPAIGMALEHDDHRAFASWMVLGIGAIGQLILLLCTAAMILLVTEPEPAGAFVALADAFRVAPRLIAVRIVAAIAQWVPLFALGYVLAGPPVGFLVAAIAAVPLAFVCRLGFASAVIERTGPLVAIPHAFYRASAAGFGITFAFGLLIALIEQVPLFACWWIANRIFLPELITFVPPFPPGTLPQGTLPPGLDLSKLPFPGRIGSGIPWGAYPVIQIVMVPVLAYATTVFAGAALAFAAADPITVRRPAGARIEGRQSES